MLQARRGALSLRFDSVHVHLIEPISPSRQTQEALWCGLKVLLTLGITIQGMTALRPNLKFELAHHLSRPPLAPCCDMVHIGAGRLAKDVPLANRVRSGRKQP